MGTWSFADLFFFCFFLDLILLLLLFLILKFFVRQVHMMMVYLLLFLRSILSVWFCLDTLLARLFLDLLFLALLWLWRVFQLLLLSLEGSVVSSSVVCDNIRLVSVLVASCGSRNLLDTERGEITYFLPPESFAFRNSSSLARFSSCWRASMAKSTLVSSSPSQRASYLIARAAFAANILEILPKNK